MINLKPQQKAAIDSRGKVIVSASAGSGKTFVMIEKLVSAILQGVDLDEVLAVTFTKKAAVQMKEKLRSALISRIDGADDDTKTRLKIQLSKISSSDISTIHSFCARLIRTYFYVLGIDGGFDIISADDAAAKDLKARAMDALFERLYGEDDRDFKLLLKCCMKKRTDNSIKKLLEEAYSAVRSCAHYDKLLSDAEKLYSEEGFEKVCGEYAEILSNKYKRLIYAVQSFKEGFIISKKPEVYHAILDEMISSLNICAGSGLFDEKPPLSVTTKPIVRATDDLSVREADEQFKAFKNGVSKKYNKLCGDFAERKTELEYFLKSGGVAVAFSHVLMAFDREYAEVKREENKLDYNDLEHLTLRLLQNEDVKREIFEKYSHVFVDEYQDVNPVQEEILSSLGKEVFLVGDIKQAIYGFRGSRSEFFSQKFSSFSDGGGSALKLSHNFRSADGVLGFVNALFSQVMTDETCGINYQKDGAMLAGGVYENFAGEAQIHIFGKDEAEERELDVYSVVGDSRRKNHTREGLAVLALVKSELNKKHFDLKAGKLVNTQPGDICILTRKNKGASTEGIVRALRDAGYPVSGEQQPNICNLPEVKQFLDILSLIDNAEQDIPLVSALLSPLGGLSEDELAKIRITLKDKKDLSFRECCREYSAKMRGEIAQKLNGFWKTLEELRSLSEIANVGELADEILEKYSLEYVYGSDGGEKLKNVLKFICEGENLTLSAFLQKIKAGGFNVSAPAAAPSDSIKIMTMHASKGLEFPVVILADICRTFKGADYSEMPFDSEYGFASKYYDVEQKLFSKTVLRRLCKLRADGEELKNELNLFYVACTRAMCRLHILAEEVTPYDGLSLGEAKCYAETFDMTKFPLKALDPHGEIEAEEGATIVYKPDESLVAEIQKYFNAEYKFAKSVHLPVKSSASAILKLRDFEPYYRESQLFGGEGETGTERGTAYHRFLELCDFEKSSRGEIEREIENFLNSGRITQAQAELLKADELEKILSMPVFKNLNGAKLFREQEFLCRLPAREVLPQTEAEDFILVQGAIDLLARGDFGIKIIDYKYSQKTDEQLIKTYQKQLELYKKAASVITGTAESKISLTIINIHLLRQIDLPTK